MDDDLDGFTENAGDCDDDAPDIHPDAEERCDGVDQDCDGEIDEDAADAQLWYADLDNDGEGDTSTAVIACGPPPGYVAVGGDCDDANADINEGAPEQCDGIDHDCDGQVNEPSAVDAAEYYQDADGDSYGADLSSVSACEQPPGYVEINGDCLDSDPSVNPGAAEVCNNVDDNCDGVLDELPGMALGCVDVWHWHNYANGSFTSTGGYGYSQLAAWLVEQGAILTENTDTLNDQSLAGIDVLFVGYPPRDLSADEIAAVDRFVRAGGGLLVQDGFTGSSTEYNRHNQFISQFGLSFGGPLLNGVCTVITPHPTVQGITELRGQGGIPIVTSGSATPTCSTSGSPSYHWSAATTAGQGRVVAFYDEWVWFNSSSDYGWGYAQHRTYAANVFGWLGE